MTKKEQKKEFVTTEMLLARKGLINKKPDPFFSNVFNAYIEVESSNPNSVVDLLSGGANPEDEKYLYSKLIYENCPMFREKGLCDEFEIEDPYLLPLTIYGSKVIEMLKLGNNILNIYGNSSDVESVKKK